MRCEGHDGEAVAEAGHVAVDQRDVEATVERRRAADRVPVVLCASCEAADLDVEGTAGALPICSGLIDQSGGETRRGGAAAVVDVGGQRAVAVDRAALNVHGARGGDRPTIQPGGTGRLRIGCAETDGSRQALDDARIGQRYTLVRGGPRAGRLLKGAGVVDRRGAAVVADEAIVLHV